MSLDLEHAPYQKIILCLLVAMAVIFAVWTGISRTHEGIAFHNELLSASDQNGTTVYSGTLYSTPITITCREENGAKLVDFSADGAYFAACRVEYPDGTIPTAYGKSVPRIRILRNGEVLFSGGYDPTADSSYTKFFNEDGSSEIFMTIGASGSGDPWHFFEFDIFDILRFSEVPETSARGSWGIYFKALALSVLFALLTAFPETTFYLSHCLDVRDPEPTDFYYFTHKVSSILCTAIVLILYFIGVFAIV